MTRRKTQIWLRQDQVDLLRVVLDNALVAIDDDTLSGSRRLLGYCARRVREIADMLPPTERKVAVPARKAEE